MPEDTVNVRYMVHDVDAAVEFYTKHFGFTVGTHAAPAFADVFRGNLRLLLSGPSSSAGRPMPDGAKPGPGGWNREASRSSSRIRPATRSSCSTPPANDASRREPPHVRDAVVAVSSSRG